MEEYKRAYNVLGILYNKFHTCAIHTHSSKFRFLYSILLRPLTAKCVLVWIFLCECVHVWLIGHAHIGRYPQFAAKDNNESIAQVAFHLERNNFLHSQKKICQKMCIFEVEKIKLFKLIGAGMYMTSIHAYSVNNTSLGSSCSHIISHGATIGSHDFAQALTVGHHML